MLKAGSLQTQLVTKIITDTLDNGNPVDLITIGQIYAFNLTPENRAILEPLIQDHPRANTVNFSLMDAPSTLSQDSWGSTLEDESPFVEFFFDFLHDFSSFLLSFSFLPQPFFFIISETPLTFYGAVAIFLTFLRLTKNGYIFPESLAMQVYTNTFKNFFHSGILKKSLYQRPRDFLLFIISLIRK